MKSHTLFIKMKMMLAFSQSWAIWWKRKFYFNKVFNFFFHFPNQGTVNDILFPYQQVVAK